MPILNTYTAHQIPNQGSWSSSQNPCPTNVSYSNMFPLLLSLESDGCAYWYGTFFFSCSCFRYHTTILRFNNNSHPLPTYSKFIHSPRIVLLMDVRFCYNCRIYNIFFIYETATNSLTPSSLLSIYHPHSHQDPYRITRDYRPNPSSYRCIKGQFWFDYFSKSQESKKAW